MLNFGQIITKFHYKTLSGVYGIIFKIIFAIPLYIASLFYFAAITLKNTLYKKSILKEKKVNAKVICIGNLTTGGVGKTPVTVEFCKHLSKKYKVSSLSRGYKGKLKGANIVRDYNKILIENPALTGDEVKLLTDNSSGYAVTVSADRIKGATLAIDTLQTDVIIMDDGFSNRKIAKDLTLLLFDVNKFIGNGKLLPFGPLREPVKEINRADGIILIDKENTPQTKFEKIAQTLIHQYSYKGEIFKSKFEPDYLYNIKTGEIIDPIKISTAHIFSGIGQPELFYNYVNQMLTMCLMPKKPDSFDDHYIYTKENLQKIIDKSPADYLITTEKDAVKIKNIINKETGDKYMGKTFLALKLKVNIDVEKILSTLNCKSKILKNIDLDSTL